MVLGLVGTTAMAGGFHGKTALVSVVAAPTMPTAAAPTYSVIAASPYQILNYAAPSYQMAAAPVFQAVSVPIYQLQTTPYAASPYYQAAPPLLILQCQQVGSSPPSPAPPVPDKPMRGRLTEAEYKDILAELKFDIAKQKYEVIADDDIRERTGMDARIKYQKRGRVKKEELNEGDNETIKRLVKDAFDSASAPPAPSPPASAPGSAQSGQVQLFILPAPVYAAPSPTVNLVPVNVKSHHLHPFK